MGSLWAINVLYNATLNDLLKKKHKDYIDQHYREKNAKQISEELGIPEQEVNRRIRELKGQTPITGRKKAIFTIITLSIPVLFFVILELGLRFGQYGGNLNLFYFPERFDGKYGMLNHHYHQKFFYRTSTFEAGRGSVFLREKPENGFRVFVLGASTTEGFPYGYNGAFHLVIQDMLEDVLPGRHVEVVNLGITATNTYTIYDQTREILKYEPDAILIYSGQNEYYGALGIASAERMGSYPAIVRASLGLYRLRTFLLMRDMIGWGAGLIEGQRAEEAPGTLMQRMARQHAIPFGGGVYDAGKYQYQSNLDAILERFSNQDVPVFIASLASNLKDHPPFYSLDEQGRPTADELFEQGKTSYAAANYAEALQYFRDARDMDGLRFRAPSEFNQIIREKAELHGARHVPVKERLLEHAENGIIGSDLMLEHLHPNKEGYFLMGTFFFDELIGSGLPGLEPDLARLRSKEEYREAMYLTELDHRIVWHRVQALLNSWPFVDEPDPQGYPANFTPETELDRLAVNHVNDHISWEAAKTGMARWYAQNGMVDEALLEIRGALRVVPYEEEAWRFAGWIASNGNKTEEAIYFLEQAYEIRPSNFTCRTLGMIYVDKGEYLIGADYLEQAFRLDRGDLNSLFNASVAYASAQEYEQALRTADQIQRINPNYPDIAMWRAHLLSRIEN